MENFAPGLREAVVSLADTLRVVVYFVCVVGFMMQVQRSRADVEGLAQPILRATVVIGLVATLPYWFGFAERIFLGVADSLQEGYTEHPMRAAAKLRETVSSDSEFSLRKVGESLYRAFLDGSVKTVVLVASLLQVPFLILQFVLKLLCYLFLPVALALFMIPSQTPLATRYVQQTVAILAWPVGFAVTELVAYHLLTGYGNNLATAYGLTPGEIDAASFGSLLGGLVGALWLIVGTLATPFLMQELICSGSPISVGGSTALQQLHALQQLVYLGKAMKTTGLTSPGIAGSGGGLAGGSRPVPLSPAPVAPLAPAGLTDPTGDLRAAATLATAQLPAPQTSL